MIRESQDCDQWATAGKTYHPADTSNFGGQRTEDSVDLSRVLAPAVGDELGWLAHYRVLKVLGRGGMGLVLLAEDTHLQRQVAVKVILPEYAQYAEARERFLREARVCASVKNDHIVTIYQVGQDRDVPYLAMELLQGETLQARLERSDAMALAEILRMGSEIAAGLAAAHEQGLIHRDIKPANIWLEAPRGRVKVLDFGLARSVAAGPAMTQAGKVVGTPEFMAPEQARGEAVDVRSDLFSLGAVLYTMCTRQKPFQGSNVMAVLNALAQTMPKPLHELAPSVPAELDDLVMQLLAKDPAERPASAREVKDELDAIAREHFGLAPTAIESSVRSTSRLAQRRRSRKPILALVAGIALVCVTACAVMMSGKSHSESALTPQGKPIRVGVLHSSTGTMAVSERPVIDAIHFAVEEINAAGGILSRPVEVVVADGQSEESVFAREAEKLIQEEKVCAIFGCWTSASRKAVLPIVERHDHLLFYPVQYEGVEQSPNIVYCGPVPNQQILPALRWLVGFEGRRRWFLVGSDYVFPATANAVMRDEAKLRGCEIVGESYLLLGSLDVDGVVKAIAKEKPDLIVNTINGDTNVAFFRALRHAGINAKAIPTLSFSISEDELGQLGRDAIMGNYVAGNYFQTLDKPKNQDFVARFRNRYGSERTISSAMQTAYNAVHLWSQAVRAAGREDAPAIRTAIRDQQFDAPQGPIRIDAATMHAIQNARVGKVNAAGQLEEVYRSPQPIPPEPYPASRSQDDWTSFASELHKRWGGRWSNPGP